VAAVELGGSHGVMIVGTGPGDHAVIIELALGAPEPTLGKLRAALRPHLDEVEAIGVASFGPLLGAGPGRRTRLGHTPKPHWSGVDLAAGLGLGRPVVIDTDVHLAALGEQRWGSAQGASRALYLTVGTGIGGGLCVDGQLPSGVGHPEMGHLRVPRVSSDDFPGTCPFHGDCWEGLAASPALTARWGQSPHLLPDSHPAWALQARVLALGISSLAYAHAPDRVVLGGGICTRRGLRAAVRRELVDIFGGYRPHPDMEGDLERWLVEPALGGRSGALGALALAQDLARR